MNGVAAPPGLWQEARNPEGRVYYYNVQTKATQWTKPADLMNATERALANQPWKEYSTPEGKKYWYNTETRVSSWEMPEPFKAALAQAQEAPTPVAQAPQFVAGGAAALPQNNFGNQERFDANRRIGFGSTDLNGIPVNNVGTEAIPDYQTFEEAEAAFIKLLRRYSVQPDWSWEQTMRATIKDPQYRALKDPKDRKAAFEKYAVEVRQQEKDRAKDRLAKLRADFGTMLRRHPEIKHYTRWRTIRPIIEGETIFRSTDNEDERRQLFEEYIIELKKAHAEREANDRKSALNDLSAILKALDLEPYTRWSEAQGIVQSNERIQNDDKFKTLSKSDILTAFENHIKSLERTFNDARQQQKSSRARQERQNRDRFLDLLQELRSQGKVKANSKWMDTLPLIQDDKRYVDMLGQSGSTPLDLFWDAVEEEERALRGRRNDVYDVLEDRRYEITPKTTFDEFHSVMVTDRRTANIDHDALKLIFERLLDKVQKRNEEEKHAADRHQRRAVDALRSRIKHLDPPVRSSDTWDQVRPRVEKFEEYRAIDTDDLRKTAYDKVMRRLREKDEDAERDRERRRRERDHPRRDDERDHRDGRAHRDRETRRGRLSRSPGEVDAYEADRRKAMADREKSYRKTNSLGLSPPPPHRVRDRDRRDDRHGRLERTRSPDRLSHYDRERREREEERERMYRTRGDPRGSRDELDYGDGRSAAGDRRRRRGSDADSVDSGRRESKRYRKDRDTPPRRKKERSKTPVVVKPDPEPAGVHSGSEEGEIEED
ncbi:MAG: hypothetical protein Q9160_003612 [Pyrenula sp. 1 TL-2023]